MPVELKGMAAESCYSVDCAWIATPVLGSSEPLTEADQYSSQEAQGRSWNSRIWSSALISRNGMGSDIVRSKSRRALEVCISAAHAFHCSAR